MNCRLDHECHVRGFDGPGQPAIAERGQRGEKINEAGSKVEDSEDVSSDAGCEMGACGCCSRGAPVQLPETTMTWAMLGAMTQAKMARDWLGKVMGTFGPRRCAGGELGGRSETRVALFPSHCHKILRSVTPVKTANSKESGPALVTYELINGFEKCRGKRR